MFQIPIALFFSYIRTLRGSGISAGAEKSDWKPLVIMNLQSPFYDNV